MISPPAPQETFDYYAPNREALCLAFPRVGLLAGPGEGRGGRTHEFRTPPVQIQHSPGFVEPWNHLHQLRVGLAFADDAAGGVDLINTWLDDLLNSQTVTELHRAKGDLARQRGESLAAFCWELEFPEVFFDSQGRKRSDGGFSCILGNPPWDKIKPERDGFYLQFDPLIRQLQGTEKNHHIEKLHRNRPEVLAEWQRYEATQKGLAGVLVRGGIYEHQTAEIEEEFEGPDGEITIKKKTTGGDPDLFKFFLERAWQLVGDGQTVGMVMSSGLHQAQGSTGLRRLMLDECRLRTLVKFDNEMRVFPGVHNQFKFDLVVFDKGGVTDSFDVAFFSRENATALEAFRDHPGALRLEPADIRRLSPHTLSFLELDGRRDLDIVRHAYHLHPPFGQGLMPKLGLKYRTEFHMTNMSFLFRDRSWLRTHGCTQEVGETSRAAGAEWYRSRGYVERPIAVWYALFEGGTAVDYRVPWPVPKGKTIRPSDLNDFAIRVDLPGGLRLYGQGPVDGGSPIIFFPRDQVGPKDFPVYVPGIDFLTDLAIGPCLRPDDEFLPLMEGKWIYHFNPNYFGYVSGSGSWVVTRHLAQGEQEVISQFFMNKLDSESATTRGQAQKFCFRDVTSDERSFICAAIEAQLPCGNQLPILYGSEAETAIPHLLLCSGFPD